MVCCTLAALVLALPFFVIGRLRPVPSPLAWRLADGSEAGGSIAAASAAGGTLADPRCDDAPAQPHRRMLVGVSAAVRRRIASFLCAVAGVRHVASDEPNRHLMLAGTLVALTSGVLLQISAADWRWIALAILIVWSAEALNTAVEAVCDLVSPGWHAQARIAKDTAAGAVLIAALAAAVIGVLTFAPYAAAPDSSAPAHASLLPPASPVPLAAPVSFALPWCGGPL